ncbi:MAG: ABC transporter ATP-binding protein [Spirochaetaceae bacterium]|nr:ABC transporter ATP-binding protein [Spirochaetaceae bacterium]
MAFIELCNIVKNFGQTMVVRGLSLEIHEGEFVSLLGGSGCGKTTTLRMIAGFETPSEGNVLIGGVDMAGVPANRRNLGMVFQNYALFPNMTARGNIGFGLKVMKMPKRKAEARIDEMLELIHMEEFAHRYPHQLSGGQQQRVALARALAIAPRALLLDEPLSALDAKIRLQLRDDIRSIQRQLGITTIYVTHDQEEALSISDRVAIMKDGRIEQIGTPFEIYNQPATPYVAGFVGTLNSLAATVLDPAAGIVGTAGQTLQMGRPLDAEAGEVIRLNLRPEELSFGGKGLALEGKVVDIKLLGSIVRVIVSVGGTNVSVDCLNDSHTRFPPMGEKVRLCIPPDAITIGRSAPAAPIPR